MRFEIRDVTPAWAQEQIDELERRQGKGDFVQRPPRNGAIRRYSNDMKRGDWALTHQAVAFDVHGNLIDGQNRLRAVIESGCTIRMVIAYDVPERQGKENKLRTMDSIDLGVPRNVWMALRISHGYGSEATEFASIARNISRFILTAPGVEERLKGVGVSTAQTLYILDTLGYKEACERLRVIVPHKKLRQATFAGAWCWLWGCHPKKAEKFAHDYATQVNLGADDPALKFYRYITMTQKRARTHEEAGLRTAAYVLKASYLGQPLGQVRGSDEAHTFMVRLNPRHKEMIEALFAVVPGEEKPPAE